MYTGMSVQTSGRSAVFHGAEKNYLEIIKFLIQGGANLNLKDKVSTLVFHQFKLLSYCDLHTRVDITRVKGDKDNYEWSVKLNRFSVLT